MLERNLDAKVRIGLVRKGRHVSITLEFTNEYDAMQVFDIWSLENVSVSFSGPRWSKEVDEETVE